MAARLVLCMIKKFFNYETASYLICGGLTTLVGFGSFVLLAYLGFSTAFANTVSTALAVLFAYFANKVFVFRSARWSLKFIAEEFAKFCSGRLVMFVVETSLLVLLVDIVGLNSALMKAFTLVLVVVGNYCFSKWIVFAKGS